MDRLRRLDGRGGPEVRAAHDVLFDFVVAREEVVRVEKDVDPCAFEAEPLLRAKVEGARERISAAGVRVSLDAFRALVQLRHDYHAREGLAVLVARNAGDGEVGGEAVQGRPLD